jgi:hypothetical protein
MSDGRHKPDLLTKKTLTRVAGKGEQVLEKRLDQKELT